MAGRASALMIAVPAQAALTPEQSKYNQLVGKIEKARERLLAWQEQVPLFAQAHAQRMQPLLAELQAQRLALLHALDGLLAGSGWTASDRRTLQRALCDLAVDLIESDSIDEATAAQVEALHDRHAQTSLQERRRGNVERMKSLFEEVGGLDLGDRAFDSAEDLLQHAQERRQAEAERVAEQQREAAARRPAKPTAAQVRREAESHGASQSVREVFRKLASALHPDRAEDDTDRGRRTALMQRVNQAYAAQDLLGLFALQLEIEQVDAAHLARASSERMRHYNRVLTAQLSELQAEIESRVTAFGMEFGVEPWRRLDPRKLGPLLEDDVRRIRGALAQAQLDLHLLDVPASAKRWVKQLRQMQAREDRDPFGFAL